MAPKVPAAVDQGELLKVGLEHLQNVEMEAGQQVEPMKEVAELELREIEVLGNVRMVP